MGGGPEGLGEALCLRLCPTQLGNRGWAMARLVSSDLGLVRASLVPDQAGREEGPGSGCLESEVGTLGKQLDREVWSSGETDQGM